LRKFSANGGEWGKTEKRLIQLTVNVILLETLGELQDLFVRCSYLVASSAEFRIRYAPRLSDDYAQEARMKVRIKWVENVSFLAETESSHALVMDGAPEGGGRNLGPRPMEVVLAGTGGCTAYDVVTILRKARQPVTDCTVEIDAERAAQDPKVFTRIHFRFVVTGSGLDSKQLERAIHLSAEKYCSASIMLGKTAQITHDYVIQEPHAAPER
jgi:putative redox protein